jgi:hypothetical protein
VSLLVAASRERAARGSYFVDLREGEHQGVSLFGECLIDHGVKTIPSFIRTNTRKPNQGVNMLRKSGMSDIFSQPLVMLGFSLIPPKCNRWR